MRYKTPKETSVVFHNGSTYNYNFIINELAKESEGRFECSGENTEKYIPFSVSIKEELDNNKRNAHKPSFMSNSLSKLVNISAIYSKKCKDKNCKSECELKGFKNNKRSNNCKDHRKKNSLNQ